jgi:hypothetical protein
MGRVDRVISFLSSRPNWNFPTPSPASEFIPPPFSSGGKHTCLRERRVGSQLQRGERHCGTLGIFVLSGLKLVESKNLDDFGCFLSERGLHIRPELPAVVLILQQIVIQNHPRGRTGRQQLLARRGDLFREQRGGALGRLGRRSGRRLMLGRHVLRTRGRGGAVLSPDRKD